VLQGIGGSWSIVPTPGFAAGTDNGFAAITAIPGGGLWAVAVLNPWVRGDGVGYYALVRAPLIEHSSDFTYDYQDANPSFRDQRLDESGQPKSLTLGRNCVG
jgi:hypothetical protein